MKATHGDRVLGMMMLFGVSVAWIVGNHPWAGGATLCAIIVGGFVGEAWHSWRERK